MTYNFKDLAKTKDDKKIFGICGGLGKYTPLPVWLWRAIFIITLFWGGLGLIAYIILAIFMPKEKISVAGAGAPSNLAGNPTIS